MPEDVMLREAIEALRQGQRERAKDLLTRLLRTDQSNPEYWFWMAAAVDSSKERIYCLKNVLRLDPENVAARQGLVLLGALEPDKNARLEPLPRRNWKVVYQDEPREKQKFRFTRQNLRVIGLMVIGLLVIGLMLAGIFWPQQKATPLVYRPTKTPGPPPTYTPTPTYIGYQETVSASETVVATQAGPPPLWALLEATYTPTPFYVNTPHPISEAFRSGQRAFMDGDLEGALHYFQQAAEIESSAADLVYYIAEVQRASGQTRAALQSYTRALSLDPFFAPAYLGRAQVNLQLDPKADVIADLDQAITNDPYLGEAYLERARFLLGKDQLEAAQQDLRSVEELLPNSPLLYLTQAQLGLKIEEIDQAYEAAQKAYELDRVSLSVYQVLAQAALLKGENEVALEALDIYLQYAEKDAQGWLDLGKALAAVGNDTQLHRALLEPSGEGDYPAALHAFERAYQLNRNLSDVYLYRGIVYLKMEEGQKAVNELLEVRKSLTTKAASSTSMDPLWFAVNIGFGRALLLGERFQDAAGQFEFSANLARTNEQKAAAYFWRAQAMEGLGSTSAAIKDWKLLLGLPKAVVPTDWLSFAQVHLATLTAPTLTSTATIKPSLTPSRTPVPSRTVAPSATKPASPTP